jgi:hypothetical protein
MYYIIHHSRITQNTSNHLRNQQLSVTNSSQGRLDKLQ